ncbi:MAG TPA: hypothetical protein VGQ06_08870 [Gemmatimonadales bacterium]|jgi:hypothetical protein|nr:hypothetical protein [Gemmatimonadales bacterium]
MDVVRGSPAKYRVADAVPLSGVTRAAVAGDYRERPMPTADAILWRPVGQLGADPACPIFITQRALEAVHAQVAAQPKGASSLGFLVGGVYMSPDSRTPYIVVESTVHIPWSIGGDHLESALLQGRAIAQEETQRNGDQLLGWYHSHVAPHARLSVSDMEAHRACFDQPWQIALVVAGGAEVTGGVYRIGSDAARSTECLPFYELPERVSLLPNGQEVVHLAWANYHPHGIAASADVVPPPALDQPPFLFPAEPEVDPDALPAPVRRRFSLQPVSRAAGLGAVGIVAAGALFGGYRLLAGPSSHAADPGAPQLSAAVALDRIDRLGDTLGFAVAAFDTRARLFDGRKMVCSDLARGLIELDGRWIAYNTARKVAPATLDSARTVRDRRLYADVGTVERRFARSGCPRP